jgi:hypothetical protein
MRYRLGFDGYKYDRLSLHFVVVWFVIGAGFAPKIMFIALKLHMMKEHYFKQWKLT